ncbi:MAG TPA: hypothetical protein VK094_07815 [Pseudogracilibacillus sp.]|nr:hypothetical protein [Pseudogracilibacillus sp.]
MKYDKKPLIIILVMVAVIAGGLLLANYMFKQVDINLEKEDSTQSVFFEQTEDLSVLMNEN